MINYGDTDLERGGFLVAEESDDYGSEGAAGQADEGQEPEVVEEVADEEVDEEILSEYGNATKEDFIRALKTYKDRAKRAEERSELYRDLYSRASREIPDDEPVKRRQAKAADDIDEGELGELARRGDIRGEVEDVLEAERIRRRNDYIQSETYVFAKEHPDFYERLAAIDEYARGDRALQRIIEKHPRPWEYVYDLADKLGLVKKKPVKPAAVKSDIQRMKENAAKPKAVTGMKSGTVTVKRVQDMTDKEFAEYSAKLRDEM